LPQKSFGGEINEQHGVSTGSGNDRAGSTKPGILNECVTYANLFVTPMAEQTSKYGSAMLMRGKSVTAPNYR
jgi:hypothetical protein